MTGEDSTASVAVSTHTRKKSGNWRSVRAREDAEDEQQRRINDQKMEERDGEGEDSAV